MKSQGCEYILVAVDYVSKWVEAMLCKATDAKHARKMFHEIIFLRFGTPRMIISDGGSHFIDSAFRNFLKELGTRHNIATPYHPQTSGQAETSNKQIKNILQKIVNEMEKGWKLKLPDALWHTVQHTRHPLECHPTSVSTGKLATYPWSWSIERIGLSGSGIWILK